MKTKTLLYSFAAIAVLVCVALFCASPQDPRTQPGNAKITAFKTNFRGGDTVLVPSGLLLRFYRCTLNVQLPELTDSLIIKRKVVDSIVLDTALTAADTQFCFNFISRRFGRDTLVAYIIRKNNAGNDTVLKPYFSPSLYISLQSKCVLNTACAWFDTIWADTCAYDRDSVGNPNDIADYLSWQGDTLRGKIFRLVRVYGQHCITFNGITTCFPYWTRKWTVQYDDALVHLCSQASLDTLMWTVANSDGDTVTQPLILNRGATCP
ncbi:MAG: hypothetical protein ABSF80_04625 [Chitinispirillaceae bacterium]